MIVVLNAAPVSGQNAEFSVLTYNVFLRAPTWMFWDQHDWRSKRVDYIFYSKRHRAPATSSNEVLFFREGVADLSDHHAVLGRFSFPELP